MNSNSAKEIVNGCDSKWTTKGPKVTQLYFAQSK